MPTLNLDGMIKAWSPRLQQAFLKAVYRIRTNVQFNQLVKMIANGDVDGALRAVGLDPNAFRPLDKGVTDAFEAGGHATAAKITPPANSAGFAAQVSFNMRNPAAELWLSQHAGTMIAQIVDDQLAMVRDVLTEGMSRGLNPKTTALDLVGRIGPSGRREGGFIGLTRNQATWVRNFEDKLRGDNPSEALSYVLRDRRFDAQIRRGDLTEKQINTMITSYKNRALRFRAEAIGRTETMTALHEAQDQSLDQAIASGAIRQSQAKGRWRTARDTRVRDSHETMEGQMQIVGHPFISGAGNRIMYPGDPDALPEERINCRCYREVVIDFFEGVT